MGAFFAVTPSFLAYRADGERCACRELAQLEIAAAVPKEKRVRTPLFRPKPGEEFTYSQMDLALELLLIHSGVPPSDLDRYSVHSFRIYLACALLARECPRWMIKRLLRWRGDESLETYARVNDAEWARWVGESLAAQVDSSIATRFRDMDF